MNIPDHNIMTLSADDLRKQPPEYGFLRSEVRRHIRMIESEIRTAMRCKRDYIMHEIEMHFPVSEIQNKTAQTYVYSSIIDQLQTNKFTVRMNMTLKRCYFIIEWRASTTLSEVARQRRLIDEALRCR